MINITEKGLNGTLSHELSRAQLGYLRAVADMRDSNQMTEKYAGVGQSPSLEEFKGEHHFAELGENTLEISNKVFTGGITVPKRTLLNDKTGEIEQRMRDLAVSVQDHRDERIFDVIYNGASSTKYKCYDGKALFASNHSTRKSGTQDNDLTYDVTAPTAPTPLEIGGAILYTIRQILAFKDDQGKKMNKGASSFLVIVPLNMMEAALAAISAEVIQGSSGTLDNVMRKQKRFAIDIQPEADWDDTDAIVVARTDGPKPVLLQELSGIETFMHGPGSEVWNRKKVLEYGVEVATGVAPFFWQSIARCVLN
jgi:hypothetical protein